VAIAFKVEVSCTKPGEAVFIVGSTAVLGEWNPENGIPCLTTGKAFPVWSSENVSVPAGTSLEFKLVRMTSKGASSARWELGENRKMLLPSSASKKITISCEWGQGKSARMSFGDSREADVLKISAEKEGKNGFSPTSRPNTSIASFGNMGRTASRHLVMDCDGGLNVSMSKTPSCCLISHLDLLSQVEQHEERDRLDRLQRRLPSGTLVQEMEEITDAADMSEVVLLQGFNWESWRAGGGDWYGLVARHVDKFKELGVTDIWLPPPSQSVAPQGYLPSQLFNLNGSKYGTQASLQSLLAKMREVGIRGMCDIVINHRCGDVQDSAGRWNVFTSGLQERQTSFAGVMDWGGWAITLGDKFSDGTGQNAPGRFDGIFDAAPDIDHANEDVQKSIAVWLRWLRLTVGFDAWRFDFVKGYSGEYVGKYCRKSVPSWAVGELWCDMEYDDQGLKHPQNKHRQDTINWINSTGKETTAFDFTTKGVLQEACRTGQYWRLKDDDGKPAGLLGWMPKYAVTFIDNHDTGSTQRHWPFPDDKVMVGYAYTLTHPGIPSLFWDHVVDWGDDFRNRICELIKFRRAAKIKVDSPVNIKCAEQDLYLAEVGEASTGMLRIQLGTRQARDPDQNFWSNGPAGNNYRIWAHIVAPAQKSEPKEESVAPKAATPKARAAAASQKSKPKQESVAPKAATPKGVGKDESDSPVTKVVNETPLSTFMSDSKEPQNPRFNFEPIVIDGREVTPDLLASDQFTKELGTRLLNRLDDAREALTEATR